MKHFTKKTQKLLTRVVLTALMLAVLCGALASCGGGGSKITALTKGYVIGANMITDANGMTAAQLDKMADDILASKSALDIREKLVAALRGYDMTAADFDDTKVADGTLAAHPEKAVEFAINVLQKAGLSTDACYSLSA